MPDMNGISLFTPTGVFGKDTWLDGAWRQIEDTPGLFFNMVDQVEPERAEGRNTFFKLDISDSLGQGMVAEHGGDLPEPLDGDWTEGKLRLSRLAHSAEVTFDEWEMMNTRPSAAVPVVEMKQTKAVQKMTRELSRQTHMDGTGIMATLDAVASGTNTATLSLSATAVADRARFRWLAANRAVIDLANPTTGVVAAGGKRLLVRRVDKANNDIIVQKVGGGAIAGASGDRVTWSGSVDQFSGGSYVSGEFPGLAAMMAYNKPFLGIDPLVDPNYDWNPIVVPGSTPGTPENIDLHRIQVLYVTMADSAEDGMQPSPTSGHILWSSHGVVATAINLLSPNIRYMNPAEAGHERADFGFTEIEGLGIRWLTDVHYQPNVLDCLRMSRIKFVRPISPRQGILDFITNGAGEIWHLANAKAAGAQGHAAKYRSYLTGLFGIMTEKRNDHGRIDDITELGVPTP